MIKQPPSLIIGQEQRRTFPRTRSNQSIDYIRHLVLAHLNIVGRMFANQLLGNQKGHLRQSSSLHVPIVIILLELEARVILPAFEKHQPIEVLERTAETQAKIVALPAHMMGIQQVYNGGPVYTPRVKGIGGVAAGGAGYHGQPAVNSRGEHHMLQRVDNNQNTCRRNDSPDWQSGYVRWG